MLSYSKKPLFYIIIYIEYLSYTTKSFFISSYTKHIFLYGIMQQNILLHFIILKQDIHCLSAFDLSIILVAI